MDQKEETIRPISSFYERGRELLFMRNLWLGSMFGVTNQFHLSPRQDPPMAAPPSKLEDHGPIHHVFHIMLFNPILKGGSNPILNDLIGI